ncbi:hypothetical protein MUP07_02220 [Candidatus Bathyarchaeota archaeon]|nr:hypothetical protein [Candidatus Bathyarchaeota archaeon]
MNEPVILLQAFQTMKRKHYYSYVMHIYDLKVEVLGRRKMEHVDDIRMLKH